MYREMMTQKDRRRFEAKFEKSSGCWNWKAGLSFYGYGWFRPHGVTGSTVNAHRVAYELYVGKIPKGMTLDHLCRNRQCVNPAHLEPVTSVENTLRGEGLSATNRRKTMCKRGHAFTPENTYTCKKGPRRGHRQCRQCVLDTSAARYVQHKFQEKTTNEHTGS